ncbi:MAG: ABC-type transport auxiliary lipoprotein family protein [Syntrophaceae bacterium]
MRTTPRIPRFSPHLSMACLALGLLAVVLLLGGCAAGAKTSAAVRQYALEYPSPAFGNLERVRDSIRVEPLSIARAFSSASMVYRSRPFVYGDDAYNRWKIRPSAMISDLLLRDMKSAGLFGGVFSGSDPESGDYTLGGVIEELYEQEEKDGSKAVLALNVTLLNRSRRNTGGLLGFQKSYRSVQAMETCDAESMARAVSKAMEALSREIILDTYQAMKASGNVAAKESAPRGLSYR